MRRKTALRANPERQRDWQQRSRKPLAQRGAKALREQDAVDAFRAAVRAARLSVTVRA